MRQYGNPADIVIRNETKNLNRATGDIYEDTINKYLSKWVVDLNKARDGFKKKRSPVILYDVPKKGANDSYRGTDAKLLDPSGLVAGYAGHLRLDFTHDFKNKKYMPVLADTLKPISLGGMPVKLGIRVGNDQHGFDEPVIVIGIDASASDIKKATANFSLSHMMAKNIDAIVRSAGSALHTFQKAADPEYRSFVEAHPNLNIPKECQLRINTDGKSQIFGKKEKWHSDLTKTVKNMLPKGADAPTPINSMDTTETPSMDKLNAKIKEIDERDRQEQKEKDIREGIIRP